MKKYVITASILLLLAGCSASTATAVDSDIQVTKHHTVKPLTLVEAAKAHRNTARMKDVVKYLETRVGRTAYVFSGASPRGWDCSGLVRWTYERFGLELPHSADKQGHIGKRVHTPKLGDIVVFAYPGSTHFYHAAIYIGNGKIINAHYGAHSTIIQPLTDYKGQQIRFIRIVETL